MKKNYVTKEIKIFRCFFPEKKTSPTELKCQVHVDIPGIVISKFIVI